MMIVGCEEIYQVILLLHLVGLLLVEVVVVWFEMDQVVYHERFVGFSLWRNVLVAQWIVHRIFQ